MSSQRRILANRRDGALGATLSVMPYEDQAGFDELRAGLFNDWLPSGGQETFQFEELVRAAWKLLRVRSVETEMFSEFIAGLKRKEGAAPEPSPGDAKLFAGVLVTVPPSDMHNYFRYEGSIERSYYRAVHLLEREQASRRRRAREMAAIAMNIPEPSPVADKLFV